MTTIKRHLINTARWTAYGALGMACLLAALILLMRCGWFVKGCVLPFVHGTTPFRIEFSEWRCRVFRYVSVDSLVVRQIEPGGHATNVVAEARSMTIRYRLGSLFSSHPIIDSVTAIEPAIGLSGAAPEQGEGPHAGTLPSTPHDAPGTGSSGIPSIPLPLSLGTLNIRNGHLAYTDTSGLRVTVRGLDVSASGIAPCSTATLAASAILSLNDARGMAISRLPIALTGSVVLSDTVIPSDTQVRIGVSNVMGRINDVLLTPLAIDIALDTRRAADDSFMIRRAAMRVDWRDTLLGSVMATGRFDALHQTASGFFALDMNPSPLWQALLGTNAAVDIAKTGVDAALAFEARLADRVFSVQGSVAAKNIRFSDHASTPPPSTDVAATFTAQFNAIAQALDVTALTLTATQRGAPVLTVRAEKPVRMCWRDTQALARSLDNHAVVSLALRNFQAAQLNVLLGTSGMRITDGLLTLNATLDVARQGRLMALRGSLGIKDIDAAIGTARWRDVDCTAVVDASLAEFRLVSCEKTSAELFLDNEPAGQVALGGYFDLRGGSNNMALVIAKLRSELLQRFIDPARKNRRLEGLALTLQMVAKKTNLPGTPQDIMVGMTVDNRFRAQQGEWQRLALDVRAALTPAMVRLDKCTATLAPGQWPDNTLDAAGTIYLVPTGVASMVSLTAPHFDATVLLDTFLPLKPVAPGADGSPRTAGTEATPAPAPDIQDKPEPPPVPVQGRNAVLDVRIAELRAREMLFQPLNLAVRLANSVLTIAARDIQPNGGMLDLGLSADLAVSGYVYAVSVTTTNIPLKPYVNSFSSARRDKIDGLLACQWTCHGRGITLPSLKRNFSADYDAWLLNGYLYNAIILDDVGKALRIKALREFNFGVGRMDITATNGIVTVHSIALQGTPAKLDVRGTVDFDQRLSLDMVLSLNSQIIMDLIAGKITTSITKGAYTDLPFPIPIRGTLKERNVGVSYADILPGLLKALGSQPVQLIKGMLNAIPQNKDSKGISDGIKLLEGLFQPKKQ